MINYWRFIYINRFLVLIGSSSKNYGEKSAKEVIGTYSQEIEEEDVTKHQPAQPEQRIVRFFSQFDPFLKTDEVRQSFVEVVILMDWEEKPIYSNAIFTQFTNFIIDHRNIFQRRLTVRSVVLKYMPITTFFIIMWTYGDLDNIDKYLVMTGSILIVTSFICHINGIWKCDVWLFPLIPESDMKMCLRFQLNQRFSI